MNSVHCLEDLFKEDLESSQKAAWLKKLYENGETKSDLLAAIGILKNKMIQLDIPGKTMDLCGTGGSGKHRFNTSTAVAFVIASMGVPVVKHGNRGSKKANGSFDFLEALGLHIDLNTLQQKSQFQAFNCCFCFAKNHHPIMKNVVEARKILDHPTLFNLIGPFCNPALAKYHLLGCTHLDKAKLFIEVARELNYKNMCVVVGADGLDEASPSGINYCSSISGQNVEHFKVNPKDYELDGSLPDIENASESADRFLYLIEHFNPQDPIFKLMCLNAGLALFTFGKTLSLESAFGSVKVAFEAGLVADYFKRFKANSQKFTNA